MAGPHNESYEVLLRKDGLWSTVKTQTFTLLTCSENYQGLHGTFIVRYNKAHHIFQSLLHRNPSNVLIKMIQIECLHGTKFCYQDIFAPCKPTMSAVLLAVVFAQFLCERGLLSYLLQQGHGFLLSLCVFTLFNVQKPFQALKTKRIYFFMRSSYLSLSRGNVI